MKTIQIKSMVVILLCLVGITSLSAQVYYVSPAGSSAWAECHDILTPCSPVTAMESAVAGDTTYFRGGTYDLYYDETIPSSYYWYRGILNPSNSGTPGNPIVFMAYPNETPILNGHTYSGAPDVARALGTGSGESYIIFDGFTIMANDGSKMGGVIVTGRGGAGRAVGNVVRNMVFNGGSTIITSTDNREGIRIERTTNTLIQNVLMYSFRQVDNWHNTSAIKTYDNDQLIIENVEIYNSSAAIYLKRDTDNSIIRNNYLHDNYISLISQVYLEQNSDNNKIYNNVIVNSEYQAFMVLQSENATADGWDVYNNTIYNAKVGIGAARGNWKIWNNIVIIPSGGYWDVAFWRHEDNLLLESDHNQFGERINILNHVYTPEQVAYTTLADWQASGELEGGVNPGFNSLSSDPEFINASGTLSELDDFRLAVSSPSKGTGRNGVDMGAFIDDVGVNTGTIFMDGFE
ncbi:hypothetical protein MNBD_GAMMA01-1991 [hydrothermal vent metagenome]|uniref:Right handed beta helix domain-containing protein n=1 Tax=hydrothermal vent metagenome TaxID=652676 RepID=A0A3B0VKN4_9ZZZZ